MDREFIEKLKKKYYVIGNVSCLAFNGRLVRFNKHGFNHLLRKQRKFRSYKEQIERINLLDSAIEIIKSTATISDYRESIIGDSKVHFWALRGYVEGKYIRVVLRKTNNGMLHFFSVMID